MIRILSRRQTRKQAGFQQHEGPVADDTIIYLIVKNWQKNAPIQRVMLSKLKTSYFIPIEIQYKNDRTN